MKESIRVCVVGKHPLFRDGVILALNSQSDVEIIGHGSSMGDAIRLVQEHIPDVAVIDTGTVGRSMDLVETILQQQPRAPDG